MKRSTFAIPIACSLVFLATAAVATDMPQQKAGLWETRIQHSSSKGDDKPGVAQNCLDASALAQGKQTAEEYAKKNCSKNDTHQEGGKWITDTVCKVGSSTMSNHSVTQFISDDAYHTESTITYDPPISGRTGTKTTVDGKWLGACKPAG